MLISKLKIRGFRSFGDEVAIDIKKDLAAFIGLNSSGKTSALESLRKLFGTHNERDIHFQDFHIAKDENPEDFDSRELAIEVKIDFSEAEKESVPHFFSYMVVDEEGANPYVRIRLEASWKKIDYEPEGSVDIKTYFIKVAEAIVKRLDPESIHHFRITELFQTQVNGIVLPKKTDEAYKYVKEAIYNYPEIYFSKLVVIGEGDSEDVIFNRLMEVKDTDFDDNIITFAPLGHRFVNHIWNCWKYCIYLT
jgi:predicted ATP-dependent endonuclease of OLD family